MDRRTWMMACVLAAVAPAAAQSGYQVTFSVTTTLQNVFVYADEWNGSVYAWDLFPIALGTVGPGTTTFPLGNHNLVAWAIIANQTPTAVATGINDSLPSLPNGQAFETVFPAYVQGTVASNIAALYVGGAYNTQPAFYLTEYVLAVEDTLKTDFPTGSLHLFTFGAGGVNVGTATFGVPPACYANCDASTAAPALNVADFTCFLQKYAAGNAYANCDASTTAPALNVADFTCFLQKFATGCP